MVNYRLHQVQPAPLVVLLGPIKDCQLGPKAVQISLIWDWVNSSLRPNTLKNKRPSKPKCKAKPPPPSQYSYPMKHIFSTISNVGI